MSGGEIALLVVVAVVVVLVAVAVVAGRRRPEAGSAPAGRTRAANSTEDLVESMLEIHRRIRRMVTEGRLDEARQFARALRKLTRRDPDEWVRHVVAQVRADPGATGPDLTAVYARLTFGNAGEAAEEYRRVTGATLHEAERMVAAMAVARGLRP